MSLNEMRNVIEAIEHLKKAEQCLLCIGGEVPEMESQSVRMAIENLERFATNSINKNG